jgi:methylated-DNA-[protein]-cysteine S-methyltransferase
MDSDRIVIGTIDTPIGIYGAVLSETGLCRLTSPTEPLAFCHAWADRWMPKAQRLPDAGELGPVAAELTAYFAGKLPVFAIPLDLRGTPFQMSVWAALATIPAGELRSYAEIARMIGRPSAVRAVGAAIGANPVAVIVPCHRVVGSDNTLTGYAGGLDLKRQLLNHEQASWGPVR